MKLPINGVNFTFIEFINELLLIDLILNLLEILEIKTNEIEDLNINEDELILLFFNYIKKNETLFKKIDQKYILYLRGILNKELRWSYFAGNNFSIIYRVQQENQFVDYEINAKKYVGIVHHVQMFAAEYAYYLIHVSFYKITSSIEMMLS